MKYLAIILCICLLLGGCAAQPAPTETTDGTTEAPLYIIDPSEQTDLVFNTENITRITFYAYYGSGKGSDVPSDNMTEIINWLGTFTVGPLASDVIQPGTNTVFVEITYKDGTMIKQGLDTVTVNGLTYDTKHGKEPECYWDILSHTSLEDESGKPAPEIGPEGLPTPAL